MVLSEQEINHLLATVSFRIRQSLELREILQTAVDEVRQLLKCDRALVYSFQPDWSGKVTFEAVSHPNWSLIGDVIRDPCFKSHWISHYQQGQPTVHKDVASAEIEPCHRELLLHFGVRANLVAPILLPPYNSASEFPQLWGLLIAHQCDRARPWQNSAINLFQQLANQIAIAIQQAELLQLTQQELQEKKRAEKQTRQVKQFLQTVIDRLPIAVYVKDATPNNFGKLKLWNRATEKLFNLQAQEVIGHTIFDYFGIEQAQGFLAQDIEAVETQQVVDIPEEIIADSNGIFKTVHKIKVPLYNDLQQPENLLCIAEDITARKEAQQKLQLQSEALTAFSHNLKQLHRLNTTDYQDFEGLFKDYLTTGCHMFGCSTGVVGRVLEESYVIQAVESDIRSLQPQMVFPLEQTFCMATVRQRQTITYQDVSEIENLKTSLLCTQFQLRAYIGTPILIDGEVYGVLGFAGTEARQEPWSDREKETIEMMAQSIGKFISAQKIEQKRQEAEALLTQAKKELELRVLQRTAELEIANYRLQDQLQEKEQAQSALQASQDNLKESERRWLSLLENVRLLVVGFDLEGTVDYVNPYFLELTGYSEAEILQKNWFNYVASQDCSSSRAIYQKLARDFQAAPQFHQEAIVTKSGDRRKIAWNSTQLRDLQGNPIGMMCIGEDITERQAIEKMKDEFISVVSHELRTPLTSVRGSLGLLNSGALADLPEKQAKVIQIATESTEHLVRLVNDILELEKLESGKVKLIIHQIDLGHLISQAIDRVQLTAQKAEIEIERQHIHCSFDGDSGRILQVLTNLLSNAIKFSTPGSTVRLEASIRNVLAEDCESIDPQLVFSIQDRGRGIPQDQLESIFERFHQVDASDSRSLGGTGLGLAICRSIVEQHGGKIWVESVFSEGSTFYFSLPTTKTKS